MQSCLLSECDMSSHRFSFTPKTDTGSIYRNNSVSRPNSPTVRRIVAYGQCARILYLPYGRASNLCPCSFTNYWLFTIHSGPPDCNVNIGYVLLSVFAHQQTNQHTTQYTTCNLESMCSLLGPDSFARSVGWSLDPHPINNHIMDMRLR